MWFVMIVGIILTSITLSRLLQTYTPQTLRASFEVVALIALALGLIGLIGLEPRLAPGTQPTTPPAAKRLSWPTLMRGVLANPQARSFFIYLIIMLAAILGQDVLLEPYAAEAFGLPVEATTRITSIWGVCVLVTLLAAGALETRLGKRRIARMGAWSAAAGLGLIALSGMLGLKQVFYGGVLLLGLGTGLATTSNLSLMLDMTTSQVGLFIGAWGMADALARLVGTILSGLIRDLVALATSNHLFGYASVFIIEGIFLIISLGLLRKIDANNFRRQAEILSTADRAAWMNESSG
jgi:BCD family chlorophyll transporter-like MFS transporter